MQEKSFLTLVLVSHISNVYCIFNLFFFLSLCLRKNLRFGVDKHLILQKKTKTFFSFGQNLFKHIKTKLHQLKVLKLFSTKAITKCYNQQKQSKCLLEFQSDEFFV